MGSEGGRRGPEKAAKVLFQKIPRLGLTSWGALECVLPCYKAGAFMAQHQSVMEVSPASQLALRKWLPETADSRLQQGTDVSPL